MELRISQVPTSLSLNSRSRSLEDPVHCETSRDDENFSSTYYDSGMPQYRKHHIELAFLMKNDNMSLGCRLQKISDILLMNANSRNFSLILIPRISKLLQKTVLPSTVQVMENVQLYLEEEPEIVNCLMQIIESIYVLENAQECQPFEPTISVLTDFYTFLTMLQEADNTHTLNTWCLRVLNTIAVVTETSRNFEELTNWLMNFLNQMKGKQTPLWQEFLDLLSNVLIHMSTLCEMPLSEALEGSDNGKILKLSLESQYKEYVTFDYSTAKYFPPNISENTSEFKVWKYLETEKKCPSFVALFEATQNSSYLPKNTALHLRQLDSLSNNNHSPSFEKDNPDTYKSILRILCRKLKHSLTKPIGYSKQILNSLFGGEVLVPSIEKTDSSTLKKDLQ
ncbi:BA75_00139T0 [Komagataella pastoris]|uniref:BA75_00139T0 n=1 Tax=Komagataella pastoris TaxID=4922 RepID=A0A1B2J8B0_PICPA|nr:BA75_00139T0 [Komagataella pastoris]